MIPEVSKLNWSTQKPTFEEVQGKTVIVDWIEGKDVLVMTDQQRFQGWFDDDFIRYAIIDTTPPYPEPLPLWGKMPEILAIPEIIALQKRWFAKYENIKASDYFQITTFSFPTRAEAIAEWNKLVEKLNA